MDFCLLPGCAYRCNIRNEIVPRRRRIHDLLRTAADPHLDRVRLAKYVPGYGAYKAMAEEKLQGKVIALPYTPALIKQQEYWLPAYVVEHDGNGNYVVFLPNAPNTNTGLVLLARQDQVKPLPSITANQLDASLKKMGRGLLSEYGLERRWNDLSRLA
jgi:hypothetical protein